MVTNDLYKTVPRVVIAPDDYKTKQYPLIVFLPGTGEDHSESQTPDVLYNNGSPLQWAKDGKLNGWIVVGLQGRGGSYPAISDVMNAAKESAVKYNAGPEHVLTGLSMGGQGTLDCALDSFWTALIELSCPGTAITNWTALACKLLAIHGELDGGVTAIQNSINVVNAINKAHAGYAYLVTVKGIGHGPWAALYDPATVYDLPGFGKMNIYDWALATSRTKTLFTAAGTDGSTKAISMAKAVGAVTISNGQAVLSAKGSTGNTYDWTVTRPDGMVLSGGYFPPNYRADGGSDMADKTATFVTQAGTWKFKLTVYGAGGSDSVEISQLVGAAPPVTVPPVVTIPVQTKTLVATIKVYKNTDGTYSTETV